MNKSTPAATKRYSATLNMVKNIGEDGKTFVYKYRYRDARTIQSPSKMIVQPRTDSIWVIKVTYPVSIGK